MSPLGLRLELVLIIGVRAKLSFMTTMNVMASILICARIKVSIKVRVRSRNIYRSML